MSADLAIRIDAPQAQPSAEAGWFSALPSWDDLSNASCSSLIDRVIHGWQVTLIMGTAVACVIQAVTAIFAGMIGHALLSAGAACVLLFAASYVAQHHLIAETRQQLAEAQNHVRALGGALGQAEQVLGLANNVAARLEPGAERIENAAGRIEPLAQNLENINQRAQRIFDLFNEAEMQQRLRNLDANRERFEKSAAEAQKRYNVVAAQLEEATRGLNQARRNLDASVLNAGVKFNQAADGAALLVAHLGTATGLSSPLPVHSARQTISGLA